MSNKTIMTGISGLDNVLGGLRPGTLNVISGRPGMGKTSLALNIAMNAARDSGKAVAFYSLELSRLEIALKVLHSSLGESCRTWCCESINDMMSRRGNLPIYIDDRCEFSPELMFERFDELLADGIDVGLVVIDYLELVTCTGKSFEMFPDSFNGLASRQREMAVVRKALARFAVKYQVPVIVIAQTSKESDYRKDRIPEINDLRRNGIDQEADSIVFVVRPNSDYGDKESIGDKSDTKLIVAKNRFGDRDAIVNVKWDKSVGKYLES